MFAGQEEVTVSPSQVEIRIAPGVEVGASSERETEDFVNRSAEIDTRSRYQSVLGRYRALLR